MKTVGIVGGIGPDSTIEYYRLLIAAFREQNPDAGYPPILINSISLKLMLELIAAERLEDVTRYLLEEVRRLARAGADFGVLAAHTPHIVFDDLRSQSPIPLLSIVEATCDATEALGLRNVGLFGTRFTMQGKFYPEVFARRGISLSVPGIEEQATIHEKYMGELVKGIFLPETRRVLLGIAKRLQKQKGIQGLILGGTELPLILPDADYEGISILDTTRIHVRQIVARMQS